MTLSFTAILPIILVFVLYFLGLLIVYALFGSTFFYFLFVNEGVQPWTILQKVMNSTQSFSMLAIPFFVMSGSVMNAGGIADKLMDFCECVTGHMKGGLAQVNVLLSMLMGGCSGSANADCAMQSKMLVPEMEKRGYSKEFSAAITAERPRCGCVRELVLITLVTKENNTYTNFHSFFSLDIVLVDSTCLMRAVLPVPRSRKTQASANIMGMLQKALVICSYFAA